MLLIGDNLKKALVLRNIHYVDVGPKAVFTINIAMIILKNITKGVNSSTGPTETTFKTSRSFKQEHTDTNLDYIYKLQETKY